MISILSSDVCKCISTVVVAVDLLGGSNDRCCPRSGLPCPGHPCFAVHQVSCIINRELYQLHDSISWANRWASGWLINLRGIQFLVPKWNEPIDKKKSNPQAEAPDCPSSSSAAAAACCHLLLNFCQCLSLRGSAVPSIKCPLLSKR